MFDVSKLTSPLLLDGAMGSILFNMGLQNGKAPERWLLEKPEKIASVHSMYAEAGADIIQTCTFGATPSKLTETGLENRCEELNAAAHDIARSACRSDMLVAGNMGPTGKLFPPMGKAEKDELFAEFLVQATALARAGVDLITIETMYDVREAVCAVRAAKETGLQVFASMTFQKNKRGYFSLVGNSISDSLEKLCEKGADVVGFNCSVMPADMLPMVEEARRGSAHPLVAQPNAGIPRPTADGVVYDADPESFATGLMALLDEGANFVGGCCGTTPEFIREARRVMDARS